MAMSDVPVFDINPNSPPRPFAVASWLGMSPTEILAGLADGTIAPPPGAATDWRPPGFAQPQDSPASLEQPSAVTIDTTVPVAGQPPDPATTTDGTLRGPDRAQVQAWFQALDSTFAVAAFDAIWSRAGDNDLARAQNLTGYLARTLLGEKSLPVDDASPVVASTSNTGTPAGTIAALSAFIADPSHKAHVVDLVGMDGAGLARLARTDVGYRYALAQLDSVAITGNRALFAIANTDGALDRFDPDSGEVQLSDAWLGDRAKFLAWKMAGDAGNDLTISGDQGWTFIDKTKVGADGESLTLRLAPAKKSAIENQVIFGAEGADDIKGNTGTDRIYGGGGDDRLRGGAGADHLEGGHGDDLVSGGSGNDELAGNQGNDELDGGRGSDTLDGGSGDDILTGGRGDDLLAGGDGNDDYVIDAGDGFDTITDSDGQGTIFLDDTAITGAAALAQDGTWTSADGRQDYTLEGDVTGEGTLTIRSYADGVDHQGKPENLIQVRHWHDGDLGIALGSAHTAIPPVAPRPPGVPNPEPPPISDVFPGVTVPTTPSDDAPTSAESGQVASIDAPQLVATSTSQPVDINDTLAQFFASSSPGVAAIDARHMQRAVAAFTSVPAPPDVSYAGSSACVSGSGAVSVADVAGALAGDFGGYDLGHESASGLVQSTPDWHQIEAAMLPFEGIPRATDIGAMTARR